MQLEKTIEIWAPRAKVWATLMDVQNWPMWTKSMNKVERLDDAPFGVGSQVRISQPKLLALVWRVTEFEPGSHFTWQSSARGVTTLASHRVTPAGDGRTTVTLAIKQSGTVAWLVGFLRGRMPERYLDMEAEGLKKYCETPT
jgi:uncharacterized membrane protein